MSVADYRRMVDLQDGGFVAVEVSDPLAPRSIAFRAAGPGLGGVSLYLTPDEARATFDALANALGIVTQAAGARAIAAGDTPAGGTTSPVSDPSARV